LDDAVCEQLGVISTLKRIPMLSPGSRDPVFSTNPDSFQYFSRTTSNLKQEALVIVDMCQRYGWDSIVLWHSDSAVGDGMSGVVCRSTSASSVSFGLVAHCLVWCGCE
jgi:hypothetical protein